MKTILVNNKDYGFLSQKEITVQRFETYHDEDGDEKELVWCNHAGAEEQVTERGIYRPDGTDTIWEEYVMVCDKCGAFRLTSDSQWQNNPIDGVR